MLGLTLIDWLVLALYFVGTTALGIWTMRRIKSAGDYFMGGRGFGKVMMVAQAFGVGTHTDQPVSVSGAAYTNGLAGIWYQWVYMFSTPFFWMIAPIYRRLRYVTMADFFQRRYGSVVAMLYCVVALIYFTMNMGIMLKGTALTVEALTGGVVREEYLIPIATVLFVAYGMAGGIVAAVYTDLVQGVLILVLSFMLIPFAVEAAGGMRVFHEQLPEQMFSLVAPNEVTSWFIAAAVCNAVVHVVVLPHHMAIGGSGRTEIACRAGWTYGNFLKRFATAGWAFTGVFAVVLVPGLTEANREQAFGLMARELLPAGFVGLMLAAMVAAVMSTCDAFMVHASALFTNNVYKRYVKPEASERDVLRVARWSSLGVVAGGLLFAYGFPSVIDGIMLAWQITAFMGIAFWLGVMWPGANRWGAVASAVAMFATLLVTKLGLGWSFAAQVTAYIPVGLITCIVVSRATRREDAEGLRQFYLLLDTPVGQEQRLRAAGVEIMLEGRSEGRRGRGDAMPDEENEDGLLLVDVLALLAGRRRFRWVRYRVDVLGFAGAAVLGAATIALVWLLARWGA
ncbi:sodium/proline symporter PutP [Opitutales bacterium ASA1]|uniref:sodium:solute symporter family protein n=1 Tax=Congregicoccus parvus TaxID=3081749 RepID=UPI002B3073B8|nr:sodium/proline symporter PutP [Opitutales bacterium ASA1]